DIKVNAIKLNAIKLNAIKLNEGSLMKRQLFPQIAVLLTLVLFTPFNASVNVRAQGGDAKLPSETNPTPAPNTVKTTKSVTSTPTAPSAHVSNILTFGEERKGKLDPKTSDKGAAGTLFEELLIKAKSDDLLVFQFESGNPAIGLQILDKDNAEV